MSETSTGFRRDRYTLFLYVLLAIFGFKQSVLGSVMPFLRDELGLGTAQIGWHFSIYALGLILSGRVLNELNRTLHLDRILRHAPNRPDFPSCVVTPDTGLSAQTVYRLGLAP